MDSLTTRPDETGTARLEAVEATRPTQAETTRPQQKKRSGSQIKRKSRSNRAFKDKMKAEGFKQASFFITDPSHVLLKKLRGLSTSYADFDAAFRLGLRMVIKQKEIRP